MAQISRIGQIIFVSNWFISFDWKLSADSYVLCRVTGSAPLQSSAVVSIRAISPCIASSISSSVNTPATHTYTQYTQIKYHILYNNDT